MLKFPIESKYKISSLLSNIQNSITTQMVQIISIEYILYLEIPINRKGI